MVYLRYSSSLFFLLLLLSLPVSIKAQPHQFGCQHWRNAGGQAAHITQSGSRALNPSIFRSDTFDILHYDIAIDITDYVGRSIKAETQIRFTPKLDAQNFIRFDLVRLTVDSIKNGNEMLVFSTDSQFVKVDFPQALNVGDTATISVYYHGQPYQDPVWGGFYFEAGYIYNLGIGLSTIPPNFGKVWYPCFDSFVERATYTYHVKSSGAFKAHCQGDFMGEVALGGDTVIRTYNFDRPIPTHLSAIAASDYRDLTFTHQGNYAPVPVKLSAKPADTAAMRLKFGSLDDAINSCEFWYGPTGWPGVGYVLTTDGALEIAGNIAYPQFMMGQTYAENRGLLAHELGHFWWGNWIAPYNHNDMWLKEGPAEYSSHLTVETEDGNAAFVEEVKANHKYVLRSAHVNDGGYFPLSPMPDNVIYGDHTYYKGASVMHNLRGYLGDSLFKLAMTDVQNAHPYETITPDQFRQYLEDGGAFPLNDFFDDQVYKTGFAVFVVDSFKVQPIGNQFNVTVNMQQKLRACPTFYGEVPLDLTLVGANRQRQDFRVIANDQFSEVTVTAPFIPEMVILNGYNRLNQARTDFEKVYGVGQTIANGTLPHSEFRLFLDTLTDSSLFRIDHIWAAPDSTLRSGEVYQFSSTHYWHVDGIIAPNSAVRGQISYLGNVSGSFDFDLYDVTEASGVLIYRENAASTWNVYSDYTFVPGSSLTNGTGNFKIDKLRKGDYAFANGLQPNAIATFQNDKADFTLFPNPASSSLTLVSEILKEKNAIVSIHAANGSIIQRFTSNIEKNSPLLIDITSLQSGTYFCSIHSSKGVFLGAKQVLVVK